MFKLIVVLLTWVSIVLAVEKAKYNTEDSFVYAIASALVYCPSQRVEAGDWGLATKLAQDNGIYPIHTFQNNATINHIAFTVLHRKDKNEIIISFSGTTNVPQLIAEIARVFPVKYKIHPQYEKARVVEYFYSYYVDHFRDDLLHTIENHLVIHPDDTVVFTGHSLGGAMSFHAAMDTILSGLISRSKILVYTYGQPRVGNRAFVDMLNNGTQGVFRVVHNKDLVSHIPPCIHHIFGTGCIDEGFLPFYPMHTMTEVWYEEGMEKYKVCSSKLNEDPDWSFSSSNNSINDHYYYFGLRIGGIYDIDP